MIKLPRGTQIINYKDIKFVDKDMIVIDKWKDFLWLLGNCMSIYKLENSLYHISAEVVYIYSLNGDKIE